jgi:hypothetical protein
MEGFSFVTHITGLSRPNTGKEEEEDDDDILHRAVTRAVRPVPGTGRLPHFVELGFVLTVL